MSRKDELSAKHHEEQERIRAWLRSLMEGDQPKMATKEELWAIAKKEFGVSRSSFDGGWILAIFDTGKRTGSSR